MWRKVRIAILLLVLALAAWTTLIDRLSTTDWDDTLRVGVFPVNAGDDPVSAAYIRGLGDDSFADIEAFFAEEARRFDLDIAQPVRVERFPEVDEKPPRLEPDAGIFATLWWSLKLRLYATRHSSPPGRIPPQIRVFVLYHDPEVTRAVPHSVGLQKGLVGVVHAFADADMTRSNHVVITHEILHTLGASDKYDPVSLAPLYPIGFAEPDRKPLYPQRFAEIMAGRLPSDAHTFEIPESLDQALIGEATALEIRWTSVP